MSKKSVNVHPLVIVSACDHHTRVTVGGSLLAKESPTIGLLFGSETRSRGEGDCKENTCLHIINATDAVYSFDAAADALSLDMKQIKNKRDLWVQVYPTQTLLGWYAIGCEVTERHLAIHSDISSLVHEPTSAVMLLMNPVVDSQAKQLPLLLFGLEEVQQSQVFVEIPFKLEAYPIESVVMDKVITSNPPEHVSPVEVQSQAMLASLSALLERVDLIVEEVRRMQSGEIPVNCALLRKAAKLCSLLPSQAPDLQQGGALQPDAPHEITDSLALSMLGTISANLRQLRAVHGAYQQAYGGKEHGSGGPSSNRLR